MECMDERSEEGVKVINGAPDHLTSILVRMEKLQPHNSFRKNVFFE